MRATYGNQVYFRTVCRLRAIRQVIVNYEERSCWDDIQLKQAACKSNGVNGGKQCGRK